MSSQSSVELGDQGFVAIRSQPLLHREQSAGTFRFDVVHNASSLLLRAVHNASHPGKNGSRTPHPTPETKDHITSHPGKNGSRIPQPTPETKEGSDADDANFALVAGVGIASSVFTFVALLCILHHFSKERTETETETKEVVEPVQAPSSHGSHEGSDISLTAGQFAARLEEILEQFAHFLKAEVRIQLEGSDQIIYKAADPWQYVVAVPQTMARKCVCGRNFEVVAVVCESCGAKRQEVGRPKSSSMAVRMERWQSGSLSWWASAEQHERGKAPVGALYLDEIIDIVYDAEDDATKVIVHCKSRSRNRVFTFRNWKEAKTWTSNLIALIEQLNDDF